MISRAILILFLSTSIVGKGSFWHGVDRKVVTQHIAQQTQIPPDELQAALSFWQKKYTKHFDSWAPFYPIVTNIIRARGCQVGCEVGVAFGTQSEHILLNSKIKKLYSVDPYLPYPHDSFPRGSTQQSMDVLALCIAARLARFGDRSEFIRQTSVDAAD